MARKGQVELNNLVPIVITFAVAILAAGLLSGVIGSVRETQCDGYYNSTTGACQEAFNVTTLVGDAGFNTTDQGLTGIINISGQFGNIGTVLAIVLIIGLLVGAFAVFRS